MEVMRRLKTGWYSGMNVANAPITAEGGMGWYVFEVIAMNSSAAIYSICVATNPSNRKQYVGFIYNGVWSGWKQIATATPPQEYNLPLTDGITNIEGTASKYWINQNSTVHVEISVQSDSELQRESLIATLPSGFIPTRNQSRIVTNGAFVTVLTTGEIKLFTENTENFPANQWICVEFNYAIF